MARDIAGEFEVGRSSEGPHEAGGLAGIDPDAAFMRHVRHRMAGMATLLHHLHHRLHLAAMLGVLGHRADGEFMRIPAVIAHDEAHRFAVAHVGRLQREGVVDGDALDGARDLDGIARPAAARRRAMGRRRRGHCQRQDADDRTSQQHDASPVSVDEPKEFGSDAGRRRILRESDSDKSRQPTPRRRVRGGDRAVRDRCGQQRDSARHQGAARTRCMLGRVTVRTGVGRRRMAGTIDHRSLARRCHRVDGHGRRRQQRHHGDHPDEEARADHVSGDGCRALPGARRSWSAGRLRCRHGRRAPRNAAGGRSASPARLYRGPPARRGSGSARRCSNARPRSCAPRRAPGLRFGRAARAGISSIFRPSLNYTPVGYTWQAMDHTHHHSADTATDPVCGMTVKTADARNKAQHDGHTYYFCSPRCLAKFTAEPLRYLKPAAAPAAPAVKPGTIYTCPMHPEIRQAGPGSCPICGMALEPAEARLDEGPNEELLDMTRRLWIGAALAVPVLAVDMGGHLFGIDALLPHGMKNWLLLVLATPVVLWAGWPFFVRGAQSVARRSLNMFTLIALGTGVAWLYSVVATVAPGLFPAALRGADGSMP